MPPPVVGYWEREKAGRTGARGEKSCGRGWAPDAPVCGTISYSAGAPTLRAGTKVDASPLRPLTIPVGPVVLALAGEMLNET